MAPPFDQLIESSRFSDENQIKRKADIIMVLFRMGKPASFLDMRRKLGIDFQFISRMKEAKGSNGSRSPYREQSELDSCREALQSLVESRVVVCEFDSGSIAYRLDELVLLKMTASCT